jgi:hypothetical protein
VKLPPDWNEFISFLLRHRAKFLLIGGHALAVHGRPRATLDLDLFVEGSAANARRIGAALADFGFRALARECNRLAEPDRLLRLGHPPLQIDILNKIKGVSFATAWRNRRVVTIDGGNLPVIGLADLRKNKRATGRPKDLLDVALLDEGPSTNVIARAPGRSRSRRPRPAARRSRTRGTASRRRSP